MADELFTSNLATTTVTSGGTTAPAQGTTETWTVASSAGFPAAATGISQFHVSDPALEPEMIAVTNISGTTWTVTRGAESTTPVAHTAGFTIDQVVTAGFLGSIAVPAFPVAAPSGVTATDTPNVQAAITRLTNAGGNGTLLFQDGTYQVDSNTLVIRSCSNFTVKGTGATVITQAPNRSALPNNTTGNLLTIADSSDFRVTDLTIDALRDTVAPVTPLTASASSGQPSVTVGAGNGARYQAGQKLYLFGGIGAADQNASEGFGVGSGTPLVISSITPGGGSGGGDLITFTANLANSWSVTGGIAVSDGFGPYGWTSDYLTPYQCATGNSLAGRTLSGEDQQNGLHLISCKRFTVDRVEARNIWESGVKCGTGEATTSLTDGCTQGTITDCITYHGYDQGISVWVSSQVTVKGCVSNASGWAGISLTASDYCTVLGNQITNSVYQAPGDITEGNGIAIEGGLRNQVAKNIIMTPYYEGIRCIVSPLWWGLASGTYPTTSAFLEEGTAAGTSIQISATSALQQGGLYSFVDGAHTEAITVATITDGTHITLAGTTSFSHASGTYIARRIAQENVIEGNTIYAPQFGDGIKPSTAVRDSITNNVITNWGLGAGGGGNGINLNYTNASIPAAVFLGGDGSMIDGNTVSGGFQNCIYISGVSDIIVRGNKIYNSTVSSAALQLKGVTDSIIEHNRITDVVGGNAISLVNGGPSNIPNARLAIHGNMIKRISVPGMQVLNGDSLTITGNLISSCGGAAGLDLRGLTRSQVSGNVCNSNSGTGIQLVDNGGTFCQYNTVTGNTARDDATGYNITSGATWTQQHGITEGGTSNNNIITGNEADSNSAAQITTTGAATSVSGNIISGVVTLPPLTGIVSGQYLCTPTQYAPGTQTAFTTTAQSYAAVSSANINTGSFTAPASGSVVVGVSLTESMSAGSLGYSFGLCAHGTTTPMIGNAVFWKDSANQPTGRAFSFLVTGLTPGTSYNLDLMFAVASTGTLTVTAIGQTATSPNLGNTGTGSPAVMTVHAV